jgi:hypothetical protein
LIDEDRETYINATKQQTHGATMALLFTPTQRNYLTFTSAAVPVHYIDLHTQVEFIRLLDGDEADRYLVEELRACGDLGPTEELFDYRIPIRVKRKRAPRDPVSFIEGDIVRLVPPPPRRRTSTSTSTRREVEGVVVANWLDPVNGSTAVGRMLIRVY